MKQLLALLLLTFSAYASADALVIDNKAGGKIVLTEQKCYLEGGEKFNTAYTWTFNSNERYKGCWKHENGYIFILWEGPNGFVEQVYLLIDFELNQSI